MLVKIGEFIERRPKLVIGIIILITIGFGILLPSLEMENSMDNFLPEDDIIVAQNKIFELFGGDVEIIMIHVEKERASSVVTPAALKDQFLIGKELKEFPETIDFIGISSFLDHVCFMEFGKSIENCTDEEIQTAFDDLMEEKINAPIKILENDDSNDKTDLIKYPVLSRGKSVDSIDIKNYYIEEMDDKYLFSIEVHDLSHFKNSLLPPDFKLNVMEWFLEFENLILPDEMLDITYQIAAHIEPTHSFWEIGKRPLRNTLDVVKKVLNRELFRSYKTEAYIWLKPPGSDQFFPTKLETGVVNLNTSNSRVEILVNKSELSSYGIAPNSFGFSLPARLGNFNGGFRYYRTPVLGRPWRGVSINLDFLKNFVNQIQKRTIIGGLSGRILERFGGLSWQDLEDMLDMMTESVMSKDTLSLTEMLDLWEVTDRAPNSGSSDVTFFIKPISIESMRKNIFTFLSGDLNNVKSSSKTMMLVQIDGTISTDELNRVSRDVVNRIEELDDDKDSVSMRATGYSVIEYEINEVAMEANSLVIPLIFVMISIIIFVSFRKLSYVLISLLGLSIAIVWLFGTMVLLGIEFMIIEVALIPMLMGLGVDYSVHTFHNYRREITTGKKPGPAIVASIRDIGLAMFLATITTFIAFLSFLTVSMIPLRDFGVLCAIGIAYIFLITITFQAALRYWLDNRKKPEGKKKVNKNPNGRIMSKTAKIICKHPLVILSITLLITAFMVIGLFSIKTGFKMDQFLPEQNPSVIVMKDISEDFPFASQDQEYVLIEGDVATVETLNGIYQTIENFQDDEFVLMTLEGEPKTKSVLSVIGNAVEGNSSIARTFNFGNRGYPKTDSDVKRLFDYMYESEIYGMEISEVVHSDGSKYDATLLSVYTDFVDDDADINNAMETLYNELNGDISAGFGDATAIVTGENSLMYVIMNSMTESQIISTGICILLAAIVLIIAYRKPLLGLITLIPVLFSTVWIIGTMYYLGYSLNIMTIMITSLTIGLGITYAIHAVERFRLIADRTGDVVEAVSETIGHTGGALMIAAITTIAGFAMLILTPVPVEQQFGIITALTIFYAFLTSILILPPVLMFWGRWKKKTKGFIISPGKPKN